MELQKRHGLSYIFISHDMAVVERVSHRVAVMYLGQIVEIGARRQIFENPQHAYTRRLLSSCGDKSIGCAAGLPSMFLMNAVALVVAESAGCDS